jgi:hypothetical protein
VTAGIPAVTIWSRNVGIHNPARFARVHTLKSGKGWKNSMNTEDQAEIIDGDE